MAEDREPASLFGHMPRHQGRRNLDIDDDAAGGAMDVIVTIGAPVIPARFIGEGEFLNLTVLDQQMERAVDGAVRDPGITAADLLEHLASRQMLLGRFHDIEHHRALARAPVRSSGSSACCRN